MRRNVQYTVAWVCTLWAIGLSGCTSLPDYIHNGFKVGPNYTPAAAETSQHWIDANDPRVKSHAVDLSKWWSVFNDPVLDGLMQESYRQNLPLKEAAARVLQSRDQLDIATGNLFPQSQSVGGGFQRIGIPNLFNAPAGLTGPRWYNDFTNTAALSWELDFWGLYRRAVIGANAQVDYSVEDYDNILVTLLGDVGTYYTNVRVLQERIALAKANAELQRGILHITETRFRAGSVAELDVDQAMQTLTQTEAAIPQYELSMRQAENHICTLLSIPQVDLDKMLGARPIPAAPASVAVGIPAELLTRRPDIRKAERQCAVQSEQIGIADAQLYPHISITGNMGVSATKYSELFTPNAFNGTVGPTFTWNVLNYGRLAANVNYQDHRFQELLLAYRDTVINANEDAENGIIAFLKSQEATEKLLESCVAADKALAIVISQYRVGTVDFNRVATIEQTLVTTQDLYTQSKGNIALGLVQTYRALGGGWQIRIPDSQPVAPGPPSEASPLQKPLPPLPKLDENGANVGVNPVGIAPPANPPVAAPVAPNPQALPLPLPPPKP